MNNDKLIFRLVMAVSIFVFIVVVVLNEKVIPRPTFSSIEQREKVYKKVYMLPMINAIINGTCTVLLLLSLYMIKRKKIQTHKKINITTFLLSSLFLVSYITYHYLAGDTIYPKDSPTKTLYYFILTSHIILAAVVLPLILLSFHRGLQMQVQKHKKLVRWAFPIWLYVTVTGVIVYLMISPYYPY